MAPERDWRRMLSKLLDFEERIPGFKKVFHRVVKGKPSRPAPNLASLVIKKARGEEEATGDGSGEGPELGSAPSAARPAALFTRVTGTEKQVAAGTKQTARRDGEERGWASVRTFFVEGFLRTVVGCEALGEEYVVAEARVLAAKLQALVDGMVCDVCSHDKMDEGRTVRVYIATLNAVHRLEIPLWVCKR